MKLVICSLVVCAVVVSVNCDTCAWPLYKGPDNTIGSDTPFMESELQFFVMSPKTFPKRVRFNVTTDSLTDFNCQQKPLGIMVHGYAENSTKPYMPRLQQVFTSKHNGCSIAVDYHRASHVFFPTSAKQNTEAVSRGLKNFIMNFIVRPGVIDITKELHIFGFSWGSHVGGIAGYYLSHEEHIPPFRMYGMDPANYYFRDLRGDQKTPIETQRLTPSSATCVIAIHTSAGSIYGSDATDWSHQNMFIGRCGEMQNGCYGDTRCAHVTSHEFMVDALATKIPDVGKQCSSCPYRYYEYTDYTNTQVTTYCNATVDALGTDSKCLHGNFYLLPTTCFVPNI